MNRPALAIAALGAICLAGCSKSEPPAYESSGATENAAESAIVTPDSEAATDAAAAASAAAGDAAADIIAHESEQASDPDSRTDR